jgi:hypothetical protein
VSDPPEISGRAAVRQADVSADDDRLPLAVFFLPACFLVEVILGGPFGIYGGISVRLLLLGLSVGVLLLAVLIRGRVVGAHHLPILSIAGFLILNGIWVAIIPILAGTDMHWALREAHAFSVPVLVILTLALLPPDQLARTLPRLQRLVVVTSLVLAVFQVGLWLLGTLLGDLSWVVPLIIETVFPGVTEQLYVYPMPDGFYRVFWISTLWCILGFFWAPIAFPNSRLLWLFRGLLLLDLFVAYSRGIWIGMVAGLIVASGAALTGHRLGRALARSAGVGALAAAALAGIVLATGTLEQGYSRFKSTTSREDASIGQRVEQAPYLLQFWHEHPVLGSGYGAHSPRYVRSQEAPYSYEHMPYALLAKLGVLGVLVSGLFFAGWALTAWQARHHAPAQVAAFLGSCTALLVAEMTNPLVLNFVSMCIFACLLLQWAHLVSPPDRGEPLHAASQHA